MNLFTCFKRNQYLSRAMLFAQFNILLLASIHTHYHPIHAHDHPAAMLCEESHSGGHCSCHEEHLHCSLCDTIRLAGTGIPVDSADPVAWQSDGFFIDYQTDTVPSEPVCHFQSRAPPSVL